MGIQVAAPSKAGGYAEPSNLRDDPYQPRYAAPQRRRPENDDEYPQRVSLGVVVLDKIWNGTVGSLSIDLKRPRPPNSDAMNSLFTVRRGVAAPQPPPRGRGRPARQRPPTRPDYNDYPTLTSYAFDNTGARIKAMRHIPMGPLFRNIKHGRVMDQPVFDLGFGASFDLDTAEFHPQLRLKYRDMLSLKALPRPGIKFQKRVPLGTSGYAVRVTYECPLEELDRFWQPPARLMVALDSSLDTGIHVTQSGLEFAANTWLLGDAVRVRAAGTLALPTELPVAEGEEWVHFTPKRLGLKARW